MLPVLPLDRYLNGPLSELKTAILNTQKPRVGDVRLRDFASTASKPSGVYVFCNAAQGGTPLYVGKASSRSFAERIPMHFDPRPLSWMNNFTRKFNGQERFRGIYADALAHAFDQYLILIGLDIVPAADAAAQRARICKLETILRRYLQPELNAGKPHRDFCDDALISNLL
ncbi:MAG TPA: hypothetical protein VHP37_28025 [Burkholderiales bacterium]|nr:hypothetical protein [Burkholderiales bacterium]